MSVDNLREQLTKAGVIECNYGNVFVSPASAHRLYAHPHILGAVCSQLTQRLQATCFQDGAFIETIVGLDANGRVFAYQLAEMLGRTDMVSLKDGERLAAVALESQSFHQENADWYLPPDDQALVDNRGVVIVLESVVVPAVVQHVITAVEHYGGIVLGIVSIWGPSTLNAENFGVRCYHYLFESG